MIQDKCPRCHSRWDSNPRFPWTFHCRTCPTNFELRVGRKDPPFNLNLLSLDIKLDIFVFWYTDQYDVCKECSLIINNNRIPLDPTTPFDTPLETLNLYLTFS